MAGITHSTIRGILGMAASVFPDAVVQVAHTYASGGTLRSMIYSNAVRVGLTAAQRVTMAGMDTTGMYRLTCSDIPDGESDPVEDRQKIKAGDRVTIRKNDSDAGTVFTVVSVENDQGGVQQLTIGPKHG
jgi:hypothetical protein